MKNSKVAASSMKMKCYAGTRRGWCGLSKFPPRNYARSNILEKEYTDYYIFLLWKKHFIFSARADGALAEDFHVQNIVTGRTVRLTYTGRVNHCLELGEEYVFIGSNQTVHFVDLRDGLEWEVDVTGGNILIVAAEDNRGMLVVDVDNELFLFSPAGMIQGYDRKNREHQKHMGNLLHKGTYSILMPCCTMNSVDSPCFLDLGLVASRSGMINNDLLIFHYQLGDKRLTFTEVAARLAAGEMPWARPFVPMSLEEKYGASMDGFFQ